MGHVTVTLRLRETQPADPARGWVPARIFAILAGDQEVGEIGLRLGESEYLRLYGGQVGYKILHEHRGQGYACEALRLLLPIALAAGMDVLWITCSPDNVASRRTLEKAGAALVEIVDLPPGNDMYDRGDRHKCRYRIATAG